MVLFIFLQWLFNFWTFINHIGKGEAVCIWLVCLGIFFRVIGACTNDFLLFFSFPAFSFLFPTCLSLSVFYAAASALPLDFSAYCSSPCLLSCSNSPGCPQDHHRAGAGAPASGPAHPHAGRPHHHAFDQTDTDRGHAQRNASPDCCNSSSGAGSRLDLHALRIPLHAGPSHVNPGVPHRT